MVGPGPSAAASERQRKLQEYLAAKGKLKDQNVKPYLKAKNICPNPPPFKPTIRPQKDVTNHAVLPIKATMPINIKLQPTTTNITGSQKPKLEPPKLPGKRLTSRCVPSNPNCKPSSKSGPTTGKLSGKPIKPPNTQKVETAKRQESDRGNAVCTDSVANTHGKNKYLDGFLKETNKENLSQPLVETERKPDSEICTIHKQKTNCYTQSRSSLAPKQVLGKSSVSTFVLKDRVNRQFDGKTQIRTLPVKSQQLSRVADFARPKEKAPRTVPSHFTQTVSRTQASKKPVAQDRKDIKVNRTGRPNETRFLSCTVTEQKLKHPKAPHLLQGGCNRHTTFRPDPKAMPPPRRPQTSCVLQKPRARSQKLNLTGTPSVRGNRTNSTCSNILQQKAQTVDSKFKKAFPQNHFLSKTTTKTRADITTIKERGALSETQTHPNIKRKTTTVDRRKQLEEWQKSKGKTYKRPPMEIKRKRKIIEEMNISFWKRIEEEEEEKKAQLELSNKINNTLTECLQLIEEGVLSNEIYSILSSIPKAENFAKYWICKAKLLASKSTFDVIGLYEEAIKNGATPIHELREVVLSILQDPSRTTEGISSDSLAAENNIISQEKEQVAETPKQTTEQDNPGIKLQVAPIPRISGMPEVQDMKLITPVRRSTRIERAVSRYPEMLQEHGLVVASLDELLEVEEADCFIFRKNDALPITLGFKTPES